jgi:WhiB family redox-sensing transcriptional regulator
MRSISAQTLTRPASQLGYARSDWRSQRACDESTAELFFGPDGEVATMRRRREVRAKRVCAGCAVAQMCLADALETEHGVGAPSRHGIYGGLNPEERAAIGGNRA